MLKRRNETPPGTIRERRPGSGRRFFHHDFASFVPSSFTFGSGSALGGGTPLPAFTYSARNAAYSSAVSVSRESSGAAWHDVQPPRSISPCRKIVFKKGIHHPQPVPAPPHSRS